MHTKTILRAGAWLLPLALIVGAPAAQALDLVQSLQSAQQHDARFASARATYQAGIEKLPQGVAQLLPTIALTGNKTRYDANIQYTGETSFQGGARHYTDRQYELKVTQPLYRMQAFQTYRQGEAQAEAATAQFAAAQQELVLRVTQAYFEVLGAQDAFDLARAQKAAYLAQHDQARARLEGGAASATEVYEARARAQIAASQEITARNNLDVKRRAFWRVTGIEAHGILGLGDDLPLKLPEPNNLAFWNRTVEEQNPRLRALREAARAAEHELARVRGDHHPTLDFVAGYTKADSNGSVYTNASSDATWKSTGLQLQVPLFQGGYVNSRVREAAANRDKAREDLEDAKREQLVQVQQAFLAVTDGVLQLNALQQAVAASDRALEGNRASMQVGVRNLVDVLNAVQQLFSVKRDYAKARYEYLLALLKLKDAAGMDMEEDLAFINALLTTPLAPAS
jgi:outer membrane protein